VPRIDLVERAPVAIFALWGPEYVVVLVNRLACALWGRLLPELLGRPLLAAVPELRGQAFETLLAAELTSGAAAEGTELPVVVGRAGQAQTRYWTCRVTSRRDSPTGVTEIGVVAVDVTDQWEARRQSTAPVEADARRRQEVHEALQTGAALLAAAAP